MRHTTSPRSGWVKYAVLLLLVLAGGAGGLYLSGGWHTPALPGDELGKDGEAGSPALRRFALTPLDMRETMEGPALASDAAGRAYLAWASQTGPDERALLLARSDEGGRSFGEPRVVVRSGIHRVSFRSQGRTLTRAVRMFPHLACTGDRLHLAWVEPLPDLSGVRMMHASSTDGGATFAEPRAVHRGAGARPNFTALAAGPDGTLVCSWLDNRRGAPQPFAAVRHPGAETFDEEAPVDPGREGGGVCPCCPTAALVAPDGAALVAFRDLQKGYRDISLAVRRPGEAAFAAPVPVIPPTWQFDGCPHDGPSLALVGDVLHVSWMDARTGSQRCYHGRAGLSDLRFSARELHPIPQGSQGNARLLADGRGNLHAVWEESLAAAPPAADGEHAPAVGGSGRSIMYARMAVGEKAFGPARAVAPRPGAFQSRPALLAAAGGDLLVAWAELDENGKAIVVARLAGGQE